MTPLQSWLTQRRDECYLTALYRGNGREADMRDAFQEVLDKITELEGEAGDE